MTVPLRGAMTVPPFHPNCRSVTAPYFDDELELGTRAAKDLETGKTVSVPEDMTYPEWKKVFVDKTETVAEWKNAKNNSQNDVANSAESGIIKNIRIEHFKPIYDKGTVSKECIDEIVNALGNNKRYFDAVKLVNIERNKDGTIDLLRTNVTPKGNWANVCLEINEAFFKEKTLEDVNEIIYNNYLNGHSVIQNLSDAIIHECGHKE